MPWSTKSLHNILAVELIVYPRVPGVAAGDYVSTSSSLPLSSGVELRTLDYENPGSNPGCGVKTLGKFFHSTLLQFTQLNK